MLPTGAIAAVALHDSRNILVASFLLHGRAAGQNRHQYHRDRPPHFEPFTGAIVPLWSCACCLGTAPASMDMSMFISGSGAAASPTRGIGRDSGALGFDGSSAGGRAGASEPH